MMSNTPRRQEGNRRAASRKVIRQPATIVHGDTTRLVQTWDLGRSGICLLSPRPIAPGSRCTVTFDLPLGEALIHIAASAKVVYSSYSAAGEFKIGAVFTALDEGAALILARFVADA